MSSNREHNSRGWIEAPPSEVFLAQMFDGIGLRHPLHIYGIMSS